MLWQILKYKELNKQYLNCLQSKGQKRMRRGKGKMSKVSDTESIARVLPIPGGISMESRYKLVEVGIFMACKENGKELSWRRNLNVIIKEFWGWGKYNSCLLYFCFYFSESNLEVNVEKKWNKATNEKSVKSLLKQFR